MSVSNSMPFSFSLFDLFNLLDLASLSTTNAVSFLGSLALFCCAQLPKMMRWYGKKGAHEQPSAMVSTSPITASSCSSPGCCGSVADARSFFDRSRHRHSTARAVLRQKKKGLNERATAATSAPALSSAGMHSPLRAIHSRKNVQRHLSHGIQACTYVHSVGSHASAPLRFRSGAAPSASLRIGVRGAY